MSHFSRTPQVAFDRIKIGPGSIWGVHAGLIFSEKLMKIANFIGLSPHTLKSYYGIGPDFEKAASLRKSVFSPTFANCILL